MFPAHETNYLKWNERGSGGFFPTNPDLADVLGDTDVDFENFYSLIRRPKNSDMELAKPVYN